MTKVILALLLLSTLLELSCADDRYHSIPGLRAKGRNSDVRITPEKFSPEEEKDTQFWMKKAQEELLKKVKTHQNFRRADKIIFFMGDGMSVATLTAARILKGQRLGRTGEETKLAIEAMPYSGLSKTYCTDSQTPDSASTATAFLCGVKTRSLVSGMNAHTKYNNCSSSADARNNVESIVTWAQRAGKATGVVTTTTVTHASPSAAYAHVASRFWENDAMIGKTGADASEGCKDIAYQLIREKPGRNIDVILGGGMESFLPTNVVDAFGANGSRLDGLNLIEEWKQQNPDGAFITQRDELLNLQKSKAKRVFGTFNSGNMEFHMEAAEKRPTQPRLKEMAVEAVRLLDKNPRGYFLFIEGGRIDHAHHGTVAGLALDETLELDEAIEAVRNITDERNTLIVVTSDHSHTMSIAGYPGRGNPILGVNPYDVDVFDTVYSTLNYAVGIEQYLLEDGKRQDLTGKQDEFSLTPSYIKALMGTHAGEDVGIFASGPYAHLFSGVIEQNLIAHIMAYAARIKMV